MILKNILWTFKYLSIRSLRAVILIKSALHLFNKLSSTYFHSLTGLTNIDETIIETLLFKDHFISLIIPNSKSDYIFSLNKDWVACAFRILKWVLGNWDKFHIYIESEGYFRIEIFKKL
jgi:hypothetical protein